MALKKPYTLDGNLVVQDAYFRVSSYRVTLAPAAVSIGVQMFASAKTRADYKAAELGMAAAKDARNEAFAIFNNTGTDVPKERAAANLAMATADQNFLDLQEAKERNKPVLEFDFSISGDAAAKIVGEDGSVTVAAIYGALKSVALDGAEDV